MRMPTINREERNLAKQPMRSLMDDFIRNAFTEPVAEETRLMALDVIERESEYLISANLPGIKKKDISISVDGNDLILEAKRDEKQEEKGEAVYRCERYQGNYRRIISLPEDGDAEKINAKYEEGVLRLFIPKTELKSKKEIKIS